MRLLAAAFVIGSALALPGCGSSPDQSAPDGVSAQAEADDFAARINGNQQRATAGQNPASVPGSAPAPIQTAPPEIKPVCKSDEMLAFLGRPADDATRREIMTASEGIQEVRFIAPGSDYIKPDPTHPRLNIMIDVTGIIRDARCG